MPAGEALAVRNRDDVARTPVVTTVLPHYLIGLTTQYAENGRGFGDVREELCQRNPDLPVRTLVLAPETQVSSLLLVKVEETLHLSRLQQGDGSDRLLSHPTPAVVIPRVRVKVWLPQEVLFAE